MDHEHFEFIVDQVMTWLRWGLTALGIYDRIRKLNEAKAEKKDAEPPVGAWQAADANTTTAAAAKAKAQAATMPITEEQLR